ncbi:beta lactamase precursor [alpha proteobacterium U9-1i]|nr:beta lactamase precursor [alpha proteobacterium U9-1i]
MLRAGLLVCALALAAACATQSAPESAASADPYLQVSERVADRVHVLRQGMANFSGPTGNVTIIEQDDSIVLVDSGNSRGAGARVVEAVRRISDKPVSAVIITHWHNDHPLGLSAIVAAWPNVEIIAHEATRTRLTEGRTNVPQQPDATYEARRRQLLTQDYATLFETNGTDQSLSQEEREGWARARQALTIRAADEPGTYLVLPNRIVRDAIRLDDRNAPIEVSFLGRANTDGDLVVWLPRQRVLVAGDVVVSPAPYMFSMYPGEQIAVLEQMRGRDFAALVPGHGAVQRDKAYLDLLIAFIRDVRAQMAALARSGLSAEEAAARVDVSAYAQRFAGEDRWLRYWFDAYSVQPLLDSAYREAKGEPLGPPPLAAN